MDARDYLRSHIRSDALRYYGVVDRVYLETVAQTWLDDTRDPHRRMDTVLFFLPMVKRILDLGSGCGTYVFYGLREGYDMYGVDPERWKCRLVLLKAIESGYPREWSSRFFCAVGEALPFPDDYFDCVTTHQTLEHVEDVQKTLSEMIRVTRAGGGIHIHCPDYRSTFEGHYRLPWFPLFPKRLARLYLRFLGRPLLGLDNIQYVTRIGIERVLRRLAQSSSSLEMRIVDVDRVAFRRQNPSRLRLGLTGTYAGYQSVRYLRSLFKRDIASNLFVHILSK